MIHKKARLILTLRYTDIKLIVLDIKLITIKLTVQYYRAVRLKSPKLKSIGLPTGIKI